MDITIPAYCDDGIWYPRSSSTDTRAQTVWSTAAAANPIRAAAATGDANPFAKYPEWIQPYFANQTGLLLDAGCGYGRVSIPLLEANPRLRCIGVKRSVRECARVLKPGGTMVAAGSFPNVFNAESVTNLRNNFRAAANGPVRTYTRAEVARLFRDFSRVSVEAHQMIVLPRSIGSLSLPFAAAARTVNQYVTQHWMSTFRHSSLFVNHHDVIAVR
jgi:SAM-dependent methyltransferase